MSCPRCNDGILVEQDDLTLLCSACGLRRRGIDRVPLRLDTNFYMLLRNVDRTTQGCGVVIERYKTFSMEGDSATRFVLKHDLRCVAFSSDLEDLVLMAVERDWNITGRSDLMDEIGSALDVLQ